MCDFWGYVHTGEHPHVCTHSSALCHGWQWDTEALSVLPEARWKYTRCAPKLYCKSSCFNCHNMAPVSHRSARCTHTCLRETPNFSGLWGNFCLSVDGLDGCSLPDDLFSDVCVFYSWQTLWTDCAYISRGVMKHKIFGLLQFLLLGSVPLKRRLWLFCKTQSTLHFVEWFYFSD